MRITYDAEVDALYIRFLETTVTTAHVAEGIAVDYGPDGRVAGIEVLDARKRFGDTDVFRRVILEDVTLAGAAASAPLSDPEFPQVTYRRGASGRSVPVLRDTSILVRTVAALAQQGQSVEEMAEHYGLSAGQVKEALAFYEAHRQEIDTNVQEEGDLEGAHA